jgi:hypothetical protein
LAVEGEDEGTVFCVGVVLDGDVFDPWNDVVGGGLAARYHGDVEEAFLLEECKHDRFAQEAGAAYDSYAFHRREKEMKN